MFTRDDMLNLLATRPFTPFRLHMSDGKTVEVVSPELVLPGRRFAVVGLLDPDANDLGFDRWTTVFYLHVARHEMLATGAPPFTAPPPAGAETPAA